MKSKYIIKRYVECPVGRSSLKTTKTRKQQFTVQEGNCELLPDLHNLHQLQGVAELHSSN